MPDGEHFAEPWVVRTKLQPPRLRDGIVVRQPLLERVYHTIVTHRLTVIATPPGYGKTTLLAGVQHAYPDLPMAWLSLDASDNDPASFLAALLAALLQIEPAWSSAAAALQPSLSPPPADLRRSIGVLINDVLRLIPQPFVVVLDDLHAADAPEIHAALDYLLERLPPQMHIAAATRHAPPLALARLRARGQLGEFHLDDLRFSSDDAASLLNDQLRLALSPEQIRTLHGHVEGWVTALQLLAGSLRQVEASGRAMLITRLTHSNRHIFDLLAEEVFRHQPPDVREFLVQTSILAELTPALCRAVTGRADAELLLEESYRRNLFLAAVDAAEPGDTTYRYHDLFAHFLRQQLHRAGPALLMALHLRAARAEPNQARAIDHFLAAECWDDAAALLERLAEQSFSQGLLHRLAAWIERLPPPIRGTHPWLLYFGSVCAWGLGHFDAAQRGLEQALAGFQATGDARGRGETLVQLSIVYQTGGDFAPAMRLSEQALQCPISPRSRTQLLMGLAYLALGAGDLQAAQQHLAAALELAERSDDPAPVQIVAMQLRSVFACVPHGVTLMERLGRLIERRATAQGSPLDAAQACLQMFFHCWRGELDAAIAAGEQAREISAESGGLSWLMVDVGGLLPRLHWLRRDGARAAALFEQFAYLADEYPGWRAAFWYFRALAAWDQGRFDQVRQCYTRMQPRAGTFEWPIGAVLRLITRGLLEIAERAYDDAGHTLQQACALQRQIGLSLGEEPRLVLAYSYLRQGRPAALQELALVLDAHAQAGTPGRILLHGSTLVVPLLQLAIKHELHAAFARSLLGMLGHDDEPKPTYIAETGETLTARELEVLRLLGQGARNRAIAEALVVSIPTVKTHVSRILAKLGAQSRTEATTRARELHLL